ncbi:tRNA(Met) cytidine acetyltransferase [Sulfolobus sp. A20]|uniref:tRNA(Met) cytidine acetyltransferase TmcA n=1 Tax=Sulfolobaceae TaxID=118883 RepID=UPI000845D854|nr:MULTISPECIES: GNAT family N-acetyltransferase [unclassified Sulfolobus]TRM74840.1 tRNA(Met) cytidine acetyltransferase [Sulfolobus sp. B5]TRM77573.1 tRNA(Met) cytidine acetyltransferase [Sulfolobus sp. A20-N-F8]TRM81868.1 tRNA(Met) cytidine acetyltransferase [Sulfolobus sp. D5]TRM89900.1 tRNA(Met) cytidine acetyltransferase [Sulfolobus sp. C3]TRM93449.1 tRNA(Met) cytidine acetyltransferase [Sulfolobus sp. A20-N-G8]TRN01536.1 tRNA(Met) cytidine acetyltransferase [Sulfolobus sp. E1]TRN04295
MFTNYFLDAKKGYYRHLAFVQSPSYLDLSLSLVKDYLRVNKNPTVIYAFHPWADKERLESFRQILPNIVDIDYSNSDKYLGLTGDLVILDAVSDFRPNYISRFIDMARGGGLVIIYSDNILKNKLYRNSLSRDGIVNDLFERRFLQKALSHRGIIVFDDKINFIPYSSAETHKPFKKIPQRPNIPIQLHEVCMSADQNKVLEESLFILESGKRTLVVTAPRGRGKSASVGLFLSYLVNKEIFSNIVVTSPTYFSSQEIFNFLMKGLSVLRAKFSLGESRDGKIMRVRRGETRVKWLPPDLAEDEEGDLIVVDEAAAIGMENLDYIIRKYDKVILVTTIHGYEGSGKAFLKFVDKLKKGLLVKHVKLEYPIRYAKGDPVERFLYDVFLLDAEAPEVSSITNYKITRVSQEELFSNDDLLKKVYGILVEAHYRNSPDDLMLLGDMAFQRIYVYWADDNPISVAQVVYEGNLREEEIVNISDGVKNEGHLIPHRIIKYVRFLDFGKLKGWRVMRIAVTPEFQGKGIGSKVLDKVIEEAEGEGIDWVGSSFIADQRVLRFWLKNGFTPVYLSSIKNQELNGYSCIVIKPLSNRAKEMVNNLSKLLKDKLLRTSHQVYFNVNPCVLALLLDNTPPVNNGLSEIPSLYIDKIKAYINGILPYNSIAEASHSLVTNYFLLLPKTKLAEELECSLIARVLQGKSWYHAGLMLGISSREVEKRVKKGLSELLKIFVDA